MAEKKFKTIEEQIEILRSRGLSIQDDEQTKQFLLYHNYYRISGYSLTLRRNDVFYPNSSMQNVMDIYAFDHEMRHLLLKYIEIIEVKVKSVYAYEFAQMYGCLGYRDESLFTNADQHGRVLGKAEEQRRSRLRHEPYLKYFEEFVNEAPHRLTARSMGRFAMKFGASGAGYIPAPLVWRQGIQVLLV